MPLLKTGSWGDVLLMKTRCRDSCILYAGMILRSFGNNTNTEEVYSFRGLVKLIMNNM